MKKLLNWLKPKSKEDKIDQKYHALMKEAFILSKTNRALSDKKYMEAEELLQSIDE
jgi:thermostable 8-oxoguanine DNA glycosylase